MFRHQIAVVRLPLLPAEQYSQPQEGRGAFGGRVLSFVGFAPNDGLSPTERAGSERFMYAAENGQPTKGRPFYGQAKGQLWLTWRSYAGPPQPILIARRAIPPSFGPGPQSGSKEPLYFPLLNYLWILYNKVSAYYKEKQRSAASFIEERRKPCILLIRMM